MIEYRKMEAADIDAGLALCRLAGWNQLENDWKLFLKLAPEGSRVAVDDGKVIGTSTTINYEDHFSWIGMVLVDPEKKRKGIGTQLLKEALEILKTQATVKLDATPAGREIYLKLGFKDEYMLSRMVLANKAALPFSGTTEITEKDFDAILKKDREIFGASREQLLKHMYNNHPELSLIRKNNSGLAYSFGRKGFNFTQIGPVIADDVEDAKQLIAAALSRYEGAFVIDVMDNTAFQQWLASLGFMEQRKLTRMYRGKNAYPGLPEKQFAILGPEFG